MEDLKCNKNTFKCLTESNLVKLLNNNFNSVFKSNCIIPNSGLSYRPDAWSSDLKLIVEFDGPIHYTSARICLLDIEKDKLFKNLGYTVIRIPYFVQLTKEVFMYLFSNYKKYFFNNMKFINFPQGFISKNIVLPADYCVLGLERFCRDRLSLPSEVWSSIIDSLFNKINEACSNGKSALSVVPSYFFDKQSVFYLMEREK